MNSLIKKSIVFFALILVVACAKNSIKQTYQGVGITLSSIEIKKEFKFGTEVCKPTDSDEEVAVVNIEFDSDEGEKFDFYSIEMFLVDSSGRKNVPGVRISLSGLNQKIVAFSVKKNSMLSKFIFGEAVFDLKKAEIVRENTN